MAANRQYDHEFKVQAVKLGQEIGQAKAAKELGISKNTMYTWTRAHRLGYLDLNVNYHNFKPDHGSRENGVGVGLTMRF